MTICKFIISASKVYPERLIKTINIPKKDSIMATIFAYSDILQLRENKTVPYIIFNDMDKPISTELGSALANYGIEQIPWSQKEKCKEKFVFSR